MIPPDPEEARLITRLRVAAGATFLVLISAMVLASLLGPGVISGYAVSELLFGTLVGSLLVVLGLTVVKK